MKSVSSLLLVMLHIFTHGISNAMMQNEDQIVREIKSKCEVINKHKSYKKVQVDIPDKSLEGGVAVGYFDGKKLKKMVLRLYGETGRSVEECYIDADKVIFISTLNYHYKYPIGYKAAAQERVGDASKTEENRFYFKDDELFRWVRETGDVVSASDPAFPTQGAGLLKDADEFAERIKASLE